MGNNTSRNAGQIEAKPWSREWGEMPREFWQVVNITEDVVVHDKVASEKQANSYAQLDRTNLRVYRLGEDITNQAAANYGW